MGVTASATAGTDNRALTRIVAADHLLSAAHTLEKRGWRMRVNTATVVLGVLLGVSLVLYL